MCGLFGIIQHRVLSQAERVRVHSALHYMTAVSNERGGDATGIALVNSTGSAKIYKDTVTSLEMLRRPRWRNLVEHSSEQVVTYMGHTRKKTHGDNSPQNAHPFHFVSDHGVLVGAHNGQVRNHQTFKPTEAFDSDSANVLWAMAQKPKEEWPKTLAAITGTYALSWTRGGYTFLARNYSGILHTVYIPELSLTIYASLASTVAGALALGGMEPVTQISEIATMRIKQFAHDSPVSTEMFVPSLPNQWSYRGEDHEQESYYYGKQTARTPVSTEFVSRDYSHCAFCSAIRSVRLLEPYGVTQFMCSGCKADGKDKSNSPIISAVGCSYD